MIFFVDELDRCRPDFAMTLLERVKHLFDVERIVFVLALDREQLRNVVRLLYGSGANADLYLRRFFDFSYRLPKPNNRAFAELLRDRFRLNDFFQGRNGGGTESDRLLSTFIETATWLDLDLRTQEQCFTRLNAIARLWPKGQFLPTDALAVLVAVKVGAPEWYDALKSNTVAFDSRIPKAKNGNDEFPLLVETTLDAVLGDKKTYEAKARIEVEKYRSKGPQGWGTDRKADLFMYLTQHRNELTRLIEFSSRLE